MVHNLTHPCSIITVRAQRATTCQSLYYYSGLSAAPVCMAIQCQPTRPVGLMLLNYWPHE